MRSFSPMSSRREFLAACGAWVGLMASGCRSFDDAHDALKKVEARAGGRIGVHALDTASGRRLGFNDRERFSMASTFKLPLAAAVLQDVDLRKLRLDEPVPYGQTDMVPYAPATEKSLARGFMTIEELCAAILTVSDNVAANLLLRQIGGPAGLTRFARALGDDVTRFDRTEPTLNENGPGDPRDTTAPRAMLDLMHRIFLGDALSAASRAKLVGWTIASQTGLRRIRGGLPANWRAGDKTGTGQRGAVNDIAIAWPPKRAPILIAVYMSGSERPVDALSAAHVDVARIVAHSFG